MEKLWSHENTGSFEPWQERIIQRLAGLLVLTLLALMLEASPRAKAAPPQEVAEPGGPQLQLGGSGLESQAALQLASELQLQISGMLARATLIQRFQNHTGEWREGEYLLPLPPEAAVTHLELEIGDRRIVGEIREREEARQVYDTARRAGRRSALLEQQRPHMFTTRVANLPPGEEVTVRVEMVLLVHYRDGEFSLRFPTTITAPYVPGIPLAAASFRELPSDEMPAAHEGARSVAQTGASHWLSLDGSGWAAATDQVPDAPLVSAYQHPRRGGDAQPLNPLSLQVDLEPGMPLAEIEALYHDLDITRAGDSFRLTLRDRQAEMDRDVVLRWRPRDADTPQAAIFRQQVDGEDFALLMLVPPATGMTVERLPRELLLVIDVSGSMQGEPIRQARQSVLHALGALNADDYVNVIAFNNSTRALFPRALRADQRVLSAARDFVSRLEANGGTEMLPALDTALRAPAPAAAEAVGTPLRQLLFVTDGAIANEEALLTLLDRERGDSRVFTVGIGSAPNGYFMHRAAEIGRGEALFIARPEEVAPQLDGLFARLARPMARDLDVHWPGKVEAYPETVPDLYAGQPLLQVARLDAVHGGDTVRVSGMLAGRGWERQLRLPEADDDSAVASHWARQKLASLLAGLRRGESREAVRHVALPLALRFSLASPFTSFVAVEEQPVRPARAPLLPGQVPNAQPKGQAPQTFAFAQGATTGPAKIYLGTFLVFVALITFALGRPEPDR